MRINPLDRALELAEQVKGGVAPRPPVGAVVVLDGEIVGEGSTAPRPGRHAETVALDHAGGLAKGAALYCTLEPHSFQGATPPCTDAIIKAGISSVVSPLEDPNPRVSGNGFRQLKTAGIEVVRESTEEQGIRAELLIEGFAHHLKKRRPLVTLKIASSLDGRIATRTGESQWITGEASRVRAHEMRRQADAVITGIGTVLADDPRLTARDVNGAATGRPLLRVVVDSNGRMPSDAALLGEPGEVLWVVGDDVEVELENLADSVTVLKSSRTNGKIDLAVVIGELGTRGLHNVMIEAGGELAGAFVEGGFVDKVAAFIAPKIIGGRDAPGPIAGPEPGITSLADALTLERVTHTVIDGDILVEGYVRQIQT
ncbi:MAG: bifunctional diaminohydroxyphosphoribosylaminopyrimidine deaminase/5-amino-6-(5-phosphoribosylamino)uracil reductase RibD [Chloroflexi bacterium]|nr:MAG: bifunctional diaminohydroxyphosphoribosylaminopyrimidine deaminase/5-amino-6-(5-phosphoribosylamino)uracil reductase RibD [Chloroflexota bacterium]